MVVKHEWCNDLRGHCLNNTLASVNFVKMQLPHSMNRQEKYEAPVADVVSSILYTGP